MNSLLLSLVLASPQAPSQGPVILEIADPSARRVVIQAVVKSPFVLGQREDAAWSALSRLPSVGGTDFTPAKLLEAASQTGVLPEAEAFDGIFRLQIASPSDDPILAVRVVEALLKRPYLPPKEAQLLLDREQGHRLDGLALALQPSRFNLTGSFRDRPIPFAFLTDLVKQSFQPEGMVIVVRGPFEPGDVQSEIRTRLSGFPAPPRRSVVRHDPLPQPRARRSDGFTSAELRGKAILPSDPQFPAAVLAAAALGTGKEASVFRVLRQGMLLSYEQGSFLWPTRSGWVPRTLLIQKARPDSSTLPTRMREALLKDIEAWGEPQLARAKAMVRTAFTVGLPDGPLWLGPSGPAGAGLEDKTALAALMASFGADYQMADSLPVLVRDVTLTQLKEAARQAISESELIVPGA